MSSSIAVGGTTAYVDHVSHNGHGSIRILIVDDCRLRRESLSEFLAGNSAQVSPAWDVRSLCEEFDRSDPDVILVNMASYDAESLLRCSIERLGSSKVLVFGLSEDDEETVFLCVEAGAAGYHLRSESSNELLTFIRKVYAGETACSSLVSAILLRRVSELASRPAVTGDSLLTAREEEVLKLLAMGLSNREIAQRLCIAVHTVKNHVHNLLTKLGARSRAEAVALYRDKDGASRPDAVGRTAGGVFAVHSSGQYHIRNGSNSPYTSRVQ